MYGIIYSRVIGDGDSSVLEASPYGPAFHIEKVECKNHLLRNYISKLKDLQRNTSFRISDRGIVEAKVEKWKKGPQHSFHDRVEHLKSDILDSPCHVFDDHNLCISKEYRKYFCTLEKREQKELSGEVNTIPTLTESAIFCEVQNISRRLAENPWILLHNLTTNPAECYNSVVAKFVDRKRINFALNNSYETRCKGAIMSFNNSESNYHMHFQEENNRNLPGYYTKLFSDR